MSGEKMTAYRTGLIYRGVSSLVLSGFSLASLHHLLLNDHLPPWGTHRCCVLGRLRGVPSVSGSWSSGSGRDNGQGPRERL